MTLLCHNGGPLSTLLAAVERLHCVVVALGIRQESLVETSIRDGLLLEERLVSRACLLSRLILWEACSSEVLAVSYSIRDLRVVSALSDMNLRNIELDERVRPVACVAYLRRQHNIRCVRSQIDGTEVL